MIAGGRRGPAESTRSSDSEAAVAPQGHAPDLALADCPLRVVIADDHEATRAGVRLGLASRAFTVIAEAADADHAIRTVVRERPDHCLIATHLPGGGIRAAAEIHARAPEVVIVMLASDPDKAELFAALDAGASGYLLKDVEPTALGTALSGVRRGEAPIHSDLLTALVSEFRARGAAGGGREERTALDALTAHQRLVLELLSNGAGTAEIGRRMAISPTTVRRHTSSIVARLGVASRGAAIDAYRAAGRHPEGPTPT